MAQVEGFRFKEDQKRALVSRLLQRQCVSAAMGIAWESVQIKRTKGRKPFATNKGLDRSQAPNFNFNVSHEVCYAPIPSAWPLGWQSYRACSMQRALGCKQ